ncbi:hypothetical protein GE21DRAFT_9238 [Neurospora crassa]|uniref:HECT domain-containing protein n=2 Tax=Neurospora crassa TaxID=5141 RepID=Q1K606_NEUCR|nr:hypothetical protein NCU04024 [Neurospora crassa OR74A]EAA28403.1 hypothetical protein NCU04024 [Neurospora crassa OR74A]KHE86229.1 hypothetical protein GE21DRAFT_9238 [Neurospora crassa]CAD79697.1 related to ubiquitin-protein ligase [Neurospora crassa]|eukprot:XP_957639.1 hypothetical protein NCU04024 [Neurospora crassa OR74A]
MTRDTLRPADATHNNSPELDVLAGLWEEARFARLPWDAPEELRDLVEEIDNPRKVYAVHKASRRHNFQLLVQKFIFQLREGCGNENCTTPTCFTCRRRLAGRAPIRRYNTTSARTLAIYLASQDNPENGLCPGLRLPKAPPAALNSLRFSPAPKTFSTKGPNVAGDASSPKNTGGGKGNKTPNNDSGKDKERPKSPTQLAEKDGPGFRVIERPTSKDYRSFAANVFGTVAFKMMEWLTPAAMEEMSRLAKAYEASEPAIPVNDQAGAPKASNSGSSSQQPGTGQVIPPAPLKEDRPKDIETNGEWKQNEDNEKTAVKEVRPASEQPSQQSHRPNGHRRNSSARVRAPSGPKPKRKLSIDHFTTDTRPNGTADKGLRGLKAAGSTLARPISQLSSAGYFDHVSLEKMPPKSADLRPKAGIRGQLDGSKSNESNHPSKVTSESGAAGVQGGKRAVEIESDSEDDHILPQTLSRLDPRVVDFLCDVIQEDGTAESHILEPRAVTKFHKGYADQRKELERKIEPKRARSPNMKLEWKLFVEQSLFHVLSDPHQAIRSFTTNGQLYDSETLWYCMLRMTRICPTLVFHSLWMAAASLFAPPKTLQSLRSRTTKLFPKSEKALSNEEAGRLLSICLHALVAAAPLVNDDRQLYDMSRIRAHGLIFAGSGSPASQPTDLCLQYEDAFSDELALRLAKRVLAAIPTRRYFDELKRSNSADDDTKEHDVLTPLFAQLDYLNEDALYILNFPFLDRTVHETRVPILLLDWARAVMIKEWDGNPEVPGDGPFGGALALIDTMHKKREDLLLGDVQFHSKYFADRLDVVEAPVGWLAHASTRKKLHLLDFPYLFDSNTLVGFFRSINLSRMNRYYEQSASIQERFEVYMGRSSPMNEHHKRVIMDKLKVASSKYLVLEIRRNRVIRDAFDQLWRREAREIMRPLKIHLGERAGEEGFDSGGVQQEFFRLAMAEALNPDYGAFTVDERTKMTWFQPGSVVEEWKFELIGLLMSLAVYNGLTLPVTFPKALYAKLLGEPVTDLDHIADGWPDLVSGLTMLLDWDEKEMGGSVEDVFARTYEFSVESFGEQVTKLMTPPPPPISSRSGKSAAETDAFSREEPWPQFSPAFRRLSDASSSASALPLEEEAPLVTAANREQFVSDYIRYLTDVSVRPQFEAFARGFRTCLHPKSLSLLTPSLLQSVVEGVQEIDIAELQRYTRYVDWDASHRTVRDFWSIVKKYDDKMKRRLLEFVTASDRLPVGGVKNLVFTLQRNGKEDYTDVDEEDEEDEEPYTTDEGWEVQGEYSTDEYTSEEEDFWGQHEQEEEEDDGVRRGEVVIEDSGEDHARARAQAQAQEAPEGSATTNNNAAEDDARQQQQENTPPPQPATPAQRPSTASANGHRRRRSERSSLSHRARRPSTRGGSGEQHEEAPKEKKKKAPRLPTAYTCYGILLLPEYKDKEMLRERLAMALENAQGFGFA